MLTTGGQCTAGDLLRHWRRTRRLSQLELASRAEISARHLSFLETGRAAPSRDMIQRLCAHLDVPLRERNQLLLAAGYAPVHPEAGFGSPAMSAVRDAVTQILTGHDPYPAVAVDQQWNLVHANTGIATLLEDVNAGLLEDPVNVLRLSLHPDGLAPRIVNLGEWRANILARLTHQVDISGSAELASLREELQSYPGGHDQPAPHQVVVPLRIRHGGDELAFVSTTTVFGTPMSVVVAELAIESFFPADHHTAQLLQDRARAATLTP